MLTVKIRKADGIVTEREPITSGAIGFKVRVFFSPVWRPLTKWASFRGCEEQIPVKITSNAPVIELEVPWEVLVTAGEYLWLGIKGEDSNGTLVIPTTYINLGEIQEGATNEGTEGLPPTPSELGQIWTAIGFVGELETEARELVGAVNEVKKLADAGGIGSSGSGVHIGDEAPEDDNIDLWVDTNEEEGSDEDGSTASVYELIETIVLEEDMAIRRSQEPGGTPYQFKGILLKGKTTAAAQASGQSFFAYSGDVLIGKSWWSGFSGNTSIRYRHDEFMLQRGWWTTEWTDWSTNISGTINKNRSDVFMTHAAEQYPYITSIGSAGTMPAGTTIEVWGVR